jgi:hypothetical protein
MDVADATFILITITARFYYMMMTKYRFATEYEFNASAKILYPYLETAAGLSEWFCTNVTISDEKIYDFIWDGEHHYARQAFHRLNKGVRYLFLDENKQLPEDGNYLDFQIETSEISQGLFLKVTDYSSETDENELQEMWDGLINNLKSIIGG